MRCGPSGSRHPESHRITAAATTIGMTSQMSITIGPKTILYQGITFHGCMAFSQSGIQGAFHRQTGRLPLRIAVLQPEGFEAPPPQLSYRLI